jgi:hypothetical protein
VIKPSVPHQINVLQRSEISLAKKKTLNPELKRFKSKVMNILFSYLYVLVCFKNRKTRR